MALASAIQASAQITPRGEFMVSSSLIALMDGRFREIAAQLGAGTHYAYSSTHERPEAASRFAISHLGAHPAVAQVTRLRAGHQVPMARLGERVAGQPGILEQRLQLERDERVVVARHRAVIRALRNLGIARHAVQPRRVQAEDLALGPLRQRRVTILALDVLRDLEAPHRLDLPLRRAVVHAIRAEDDLVLAEVLEELAEQVRAHRREGDDDAAEGRADLGVDVAQLAAGLRELGEPGDVRLAVAQLLVADVVEPGLRPEERRHAAEAGVVDDEVELRPVARRLRDVGRLAEFRRVDRGRREALVDADVAEARMAPQLVALPHDELIRRVRDLLVVEAPLPHQIVRRIAVRLRRGGHGIALPRIRTVLLDLLLHEVQALTARIELAVRQHALRARDLVDEIAHRRRLLR